MSVAGYYRALMNLSGGLYPTDQLYYLFDSRNPLSYSLVGSNVSEMKSIDGDTLFYFQQSTDANRASLVGDQVVFSSAQSDIYKFSDNFALNFLSDGSSSWTWSMVIERDTIKRWVTFLDSTRFSGNGIFIRSDNQEFQVQIRGGSPSTTQTVKVSGLIDDTKKRITVTFDNTATIGSTAIRIYEGTTEVGSGNLQNNDYRTASFGFALGNLESGGSTFGYNGEWEQLQIYKKILSSQELTLLNSY